MSRNLKILIVFGILLLMVAVTGLIISFITTTVQQPGFPFGRPQEITVADARLYTVVRTVITTINIALLLVLVATYASIYLKTRSEFTIGLVIFALVFLMKDLVASPLLLVGGFGFGMVGFGAGALGLWLVILSDLFEVVALSVLLYLSVK